MPLNSGFISDHVHIMYYTWSITVLLQLPEHTYTDLVLYCMSLYSRQWKTFKPILEKKKNNQNYQLKMIKFSYCFQVQFPEHFC